MTVHTPLSKHSRGIDCRRIVLARIAGFCFGVRRAVEITLKERARSNMPMTTLGPLVHNPQVADKLRQDGIDAANDLAGIAGGTVVISAHGVSPEMRRRISMRGLDTLDATCPFVTKVHRSARMLHEQGYQILLVGDRGHTEVAGVVGAIEALGGSVTLVCSASEVAGLALGRKVGVISQTTQYTNTFVEIVGEVCRRADDVRAVNTVCGATEELQEAAVQMAREVEVAIVIGGRSSANSRRLRELCAAQGIPAYQIEHEDEIDEAWLDGKTAIGLTAGASTPDWVIENVARRLNNGKLPEDWKIGHPDEKTSLA